MKAYRIKHWEDRENAETRKYVDLLWFRNKVKLMGEGLGHTLAAPNGRGPHLYGMFKLIEQIAAGGRLEQRGWLYRNGSPMTAARIASLLRLPLGDCEEALHFFSTPPLDWIEYTDFPGESPELPPPVGSAVGESPEHLPASRRAPGDLQHPTDRLPTVKQRPTISTKKERNGGFASPEAAAQAQRQQFAAAKGRKEELEATPEEDRTPGDEGELKKMRTLLRTLQKKQARNDFTPVEEDKQ